MKFLRMTVLVFLWQNVNTQIDLKYPSPLKTKIFEKTPGNVAFQVTWNPVKSWDANNPIIGYKLVIWEMKLKPVYEIIGENLKLVEDKDSPLSSTIPTGEPNIFDVSPNNSKIIFENVKRGVWYELSALAYTKKGQGPLSPEIGVKVGKKEENV